MEGGHEACLGGGIQPEGPADPGHLPCGEHEPKPQQGAVRQGQQPGSQQGGLQKGGQAESHHQIGRAHV